MNEKEFMMWVGCDEYRRDVEGHDEEPVDYNQQDEENDDDEYMIPNL